MPTRIGGANDDSWGQLLRLAGIGLAGYGAFKALRAGKLTPHAAFAVVGLLIALRPER